LPSGSHGSDCSSAAAISAPLAQQGEPVALLAIARDQRHRQQGQQASGHQYYRVRQRHFLRQPEDQQPLSAQQNRPVAARTLQHQAKTQAKGEKQHRKIGALHQVQADAPQAKPRGGKDKATADNREQPGEKGVHCQLSNMRRASSTSLLTPSFSSRLAR
jgi:hypothetical protein